MDKSKIEPHQLELLGKLANKFDTMRHDLYSYLDRLLYRVNFEGDEGISQTIIPLDNRANWHEDAPPRFQNLSFYPEFWSENEMKEWSKRRFTDTLQLTHA